MKKSTIITAALLVAGSFAMAQVPTSPATKPPVVKAPEHPGWQFKPNVPITFTVTVQSGLLDNYIYTYQNGGPIDISKSPKLSGENITNIKAMYQVAIDSVNQAILKSYNKFIKDDQARFTKDTTELYHPKPVAKK